MYSLHFEDLATHYVQDPWWLEYPDQAIVILGDCLYEGAEASQYARSDEGNIFVETDWKLSSSGKFKLKSMPSRKCSVILLQYSML